MGITHTVHLIENVGTNKAIKIHDWKSLRSRYGRDRNTILRQNPPINENEYKDLIDRIPREWKGGNSLLNRVKSANPTLTTKQLIQRRDHELGTWIHTVYQCTPHIA